MVIIKNDKVCMGYMIGDVKVECNTILGHVYAVKGAFHGTCERCLDASLEVYKISKGE